MIVILIILIILIYFWSVFYYSVLSPWVACGAASSTCSTHPVLAETIEWRMQAMMLATDLGTVKPVACRPAGLQVQVCCETKDQGTRTKAGMHRGLCVLHRIARVTMG